MSVSSLLIKIIAPADSTRGNKIRLAVSRARNRRIINLLKTRYNTNRLAYYSHTPTKKIKNNTKKVSIIVPCYNTPQKYFEPLLASVFDQGYQNWELVVVDASDDSRISKYIKNRSQADTRITYVKTHNKGIALNTNKGIYSAKGELIAFLDHDDTLDPDALAESVELFLKHESLGLVYSDEDKISDDGEQYFEPHFKPDFSLDLLRNVNYITHFVVVKKSIAEALQGIREGFDGAQDYDFLLRATDAGVHIGHVPKILYHWRQAEGSTAADFSNKKHVTAAGCRALQDHYKRRGIINVTPRAIEKRPGFYKTDYQLDQNKRQIIVDFSETMITQPEKDYILNRYKLNKDVIKHSIEVFEDRAPNESDNNQLIVQGAFVPESDSTDIRSLFGLAQEKGVAGVSPKIVCDGRIYDSGIVKVAGVNAHLFKGVNPERPMGFGSVEWVRNVDQLTGNVGVYSHDKESSRNIIWSHSKFIAFPSTRPRELTNKHNYYNPNLAEYVEIVEEPYVAPANLVEADK